MKVTSLGRSWVNRSNATSAPSTSVFHQKGNVSLNESFTLPWQVAERTASATKVLPAADAQQISILEQLFCEIVRLGASVVPTPPKQRGGVIMEAAFAPPAAGQTLAQIKLPLPHIKESLIAQSFLLNAADLKAVVASYVAKFINYLSDAELLRLIVVAGHEYGHLKSFRHGNHTKALELGLAYLQQQVSSAAIIDNYTWLVFKEEYQAWYNASSLLQRFPFNGWDLFTQVKNHSLRTYIHELKLETAKVSTFHRLARFGDDFVKNCTRQFFKG